MKSRLSLLAAFILAGCSIPSLPNSATSSVTVFKNVRIIDGLSNEPIENGALVLRADKIEAVLKSGEPLPKGATVYDMNGKTVMPTLIAAHSHLGLTNGTQAGANLMTEENVHRQLIKFMTYGVGAVMSLGTDHDFIWEMRERRNKNELQGPLILTAGHGFGMDQGAPPAAMGMDQVYRPNSVTDVKKEIEELAPHHPDIIKIWVDDFGHSMKKKMDPAIYRAVITEAHKRGFKVAAHVYYLADAKRLAKDGVDVFAHSVRDKPVDKEFVALMKKNNIAYIPTLALDEAFFIYAEKPSWMHGEFFKRALDAGMYDWLTSSAYQPKDSAHHDLQIAKENVLTLLEARVRIGLGTDSGATIMRIEGFSEHHELELLVSAGLTPMQALQAATSVNASILGVSSQMGTLEAGKKADLLVLNENPLNDIRNTQDIESVWLEGVKASPGPLAPASMTP